MAAESVSSVDFHRGRRWPAGVKRETEVPSAFDVVASVAFRVPLSAVLFVLVPLADVGHVNSRCDKNDDEEHKRDDCCNEDDETSTGRHIVPPLAAG